MLPNPVIVPFETTPTATGLPRASIPAVCSPPPPHATNVMLATSVMPLQIFIVLSSVRSLLYPVSAEPKSNSLFGAPLFNLVFC